MKTYFFVLLFLLLLKEASGQTPVFHVRLNGDDTQIRELTDPVHTLYIEEATLNSFEIRVSGLVGATTYTIKTGQNQVAKLSQAGAWVKVSDVQNMIGKLFEISGPNNYTSSFIFQQKANSDEDKVVQNQGTINFPPLSATEHIENLLPGLSPSEYGLVVESAPPDVSKYAGEKYTHIFLDQFGNVLMGAIPQGISNRQYVVHIVYLTVADNPSAITYSLRQTKGTFNHSLVFNNAGQLSDFRVQESEEKEVKRITYVWTHQEFLLRTATDDIEFEIYRSSLVPGEPLKIETEFIAKHTLSMSKVFHGSFDIGLVNSQLDDPNYEHVLLDPSPDDPGIERRTVKRGEAGERVFLTAMATFYFSPIVFAKSLVDDDIPKYKITGRNFLDDHTLFERIYPAVGVSLNEKALENIFVGLNWEIARGASVFGGWHFGKVRTFNAPDDFVYGQTEMSTAEFNIRKDASWEHDYAIGLNLDIMVITNLLGGRSDED